MADPAAPVAVAAGRLTVFRVKRRRDDDAVDALLLDTHGPRLPKSARQGEGSAAPTGAGAASAVRVFRRVDTVSVTAQFTSETAARLRERVAADHAARARGVPAPTAQSAQEWRHRVLAEHQRLLSQAARYRVVAQAREHQRRQATQATVTPPAGPLSDAAADLFRLYDVVREDDDDEGGSGSGSGRLTPTPPDEDGRRPPRVRAAKPKAGTLLVNNRPMVREQVGEGDYVYDVYVQAATSAAAHPDAGSVTALLGRAAALVRLETFDDDLVFDVDDPADVAGAGRAEYDTDPDSNDEDYYANDYPDERDDGGVSGDEEDDAEDGDGDDDDDVDGAKARGGAAAADPVGAEFLGWKSPSFKMFRDATRTGLDPGSDDDDSDGNDDDDHGDPGRASPWRLRTTGAGTHLRGLTGLQLADPDADPVGDDDDDDDELLEQFGDLHRDSRASRLAASSRVVVDSASSSDAGGDDDDA